MPHNSSIVVLSCQSMPKKVIKIQSVNIYTYPKLVIHAKQATQIVLGDLHANAIKLVYSLILHGVVEIAEDDYARLVEIYQCAVDELSDGDLSDFNMIINKMSVKTTTHNSLLFLGDELADRGQNDWFILKILHRLHHAGIKFDILLSNHGFEFISAHERETPVFTIKQMNAELTASLMNLQKLIDYKLITRSSIDAMLAESYYPHLKLLAYSIDQQEINIFSHAPIDLDVIKNIAFQFQLDDVEYHDETMFALANTIDDINQEFKQRVQDKCVNELVRGQTRAQREAGFLNDPINFLIWNRNQRHLKRDLIHQGYRVLYVHGHDSTATKEMNVLNLDNFLGKALVCHRGPYVVLTTTGCSFTATPCLDNIDAAEDEFNYMGLASLLSVEAFPKEAASDKPAIQPYRDVAKPSNPHQILASVTRMSLAFWSTGLLGRLEPYQTKFPNQDLEPTTSPDSLDGTVNDPSLLA